ncbi:unnamed protein product [Ilex paraguariensis]|uniref:Uncharacterized protein n=1 Tax=Ilex paraguariensis TaxID=185542 RepID=A0ABC8R8G2_9AQUA
MWMVLSILSSLILSLEHIITDFFGSPLTVTPSDSMELSLLLYQPSKPLLHCQSLISISISRKRLPNRNASLLPCRCSSTSSGATAKPETISLQQEGRRALLGCFLAAAAGICVCDVAGAVSSSRRALRGSKIPESEYTTLPNGLKSV